MGSNTETSYITYIYIIQRTLHSTRPRINLFIDVPVDFQYCASLNIIALAWRTFGRARSRRLYGFVWAQFHHFSSATQRLLGISHSIHSFLPISIAALLYISLCEGILPSQLIICFQWPTKYHTILGIIQFNAAASSSSRSEKTFMHCRPSRSN